jgi:hypothetical protein
MRTAAIVVALVLAAPAARAGDPAAAEALFRDGRRAMEAKDYARACPKFEESQRLEPAPGTLLNLADCEEKLGRLASAWTHFGQLVQSLSPKDERYATVKERFDALEKRVPRLTVTLDVGAPNGARVSRDGVQLGAASYGVAVPVDPGAHAIVVEADGRAPRKYDVTLGEGDAKTIAVTAGDPIAVAPPPTPSASASAKSLVVTQPPSPIEPPRSPTVSYVVGGAGILALAAGSFFGVRALSKESDSTALCSGNACRTQAGVDAHASARSWALASDVFIGLGIAAIGVATYMLVTSHAPSPTVARALSLGATF